MMKLQVPNYFSGGKCNLDIRQAVEYQLDLRAYDASGALEGVEERVRKITEFLMVLTATLHEKGVLTTRDMAELLSSVDVEDDQ